MKRLYNAISSDIANNKKRMRGRSASVELLWLLISTSSRIRDEFNVMGMMAMGALKMVKHS
jgi:hypothetical protein